MLRTVVLPAPLGPTMTQNSPFSMEKVMPSAARMVTSPIRYSLTTS